MGKQITLFIATTFVLLTLIPVGARAQTLINSKGTRLTADTTGDAWKNDGARARVALITLSDGTTPRPDSAALVAGDNGRVGIGLVNPSGILDIKGKMYVNNKQTIYHAGALNPNFTGSLFVGNGGTNLTNNGTFGEGSFNTGMGIDVLTANTTGGWNTAAGYEALNLNTTGHSNTAYGNNALSKNTTGYSNVAVGNISLGVNETGTGNTAVGALTFPQLESGVNNTVIGNFSGSGITSGSSNTLLGARIGAENLLPADLSNNIIIADGEGTQRIRVLANGNTGIGTETPKSRLDISGYARLGAADVNADTMATASDRAGMIRYNATSKTLQYHDNTQWQTAASTAIADTTNDAWVNDNTNTVVKLGTLSDGAVRPAGTDVVIKDNGRVGIGTANPESTLDIQGTGSAGSVRIKRAHGASEPWADIAAPGLAFTRTRGSIASPADILAGDLLGKIVFQGYVGGSTPTFGTFAYIANSTTRGDGRFSFLKDNGNYGNELVSINTTTGNMGVGVTAPASTLSVNGSFSTNIRSSGGTLTSSDSYIIATGNITLPTASTCKGRRYHIKNTGTAKTISSYIGQDGSASTSLVATSVLHLVSDGTNWQQF